MRASVTAAQVDWLTEQQAVRATKTRHRYSLDQFGLQPAQVQEAFAPYVSAARTWLRPT